MGPVKVNGCTCTHNSLGLGTNLKWHAPLPTVRVCLVSRLYWGLLRGGPPKAASVRTGGRSCSGLCRDICGVHHVCETIGYPARGPGLTDSGAAAAAAAFCRETAAPRLSTWGRHARTCFTSGRSLALNDDSRCSTPSVGRKWRLGSDTQFV